jgi:hypothetical protein
MKIIYVLRVAACLHAVLICLQPIFAGIYLDGSPEGLRMHEPTGHVLVYLGLAQLLAAIIWWRTGGRWIAPVVSLLIVTGEVFQVVVGYSRQLAIHIPLGITLVAGTIAFAFWISRRAVA